MKPYRAKEGETWVSIATGAKVELTEVNNVVVRYSYVETGFKSALTTLDFYAKFQKKVK